MFSTTSDAVLWKWCYHGGTAARAGRRTLLSSLARSRSIPDFTGCGTRMRIISARYAGQLSGSHRKTIVTDTGWSNNLRGSLGFRVMLPFEIIVVLFWLGLVVANPN